MARLFSADPITKTKTYFHWNEADESFHLETVQDVEDIAELNKAPYAAFNEKGASKWKGDMHRVASIPMNVYMDLQKRGIADDEKALRKWLDDPDNRVFRTRPGKLSR